MEKIFDIKQLLQKPIAMMTGEELTFLLNSSMEAKANEQTPVVQKRTYYGIEGIAQVFGCSVPTANRIKRSGNPKLIHTEALDHIICHNRPRAELDMVELCLDVMERNNLTQLSFCPNDIHTLLINTHVKIEKWQILKVLKERWKLKPADNAYRYTTYNIDYNDATNYMAVQRTGRYYTVRRDYLEQLRC